jgi:hypothetical protein
MRIRSPFLVVPCIHNDRHELHLFHEDPAERAAWCALDEHELAENFLRRVGEREGQLANPLDPPRAFCGHRCETWRPWRIGSAEPRNFDPFLPLQGQLGPGWEWIEREILEAREQLQAWWCNGCRRAAGLRPADSKARNVGGVLSSFRAKGARGV